MRPWIVLTGGLSPAERGLEQLRLYKNYAECIERAGGVPILAAGGEDNMPELLEEKADGLFLTGGGDMDPAYFGQEDETGERSYDSWRDALEYRLCHRFLQLGKPILGVCRGFQILNIVCGGTIHQDIEQKLGVRHPVGTMHWVRALPGSWWEKACGERFLVNSFHHQALDVIGKGLCVTAWEEASGIAEALEHEKLPVMGVQWHPERMCRNGLLTPGGPLMETYFDRFIRLCG